MMKFNGFCTYGIRRMCRYRSYIHFLKLLWKSSFPKQWQLKSRNMYSEGLESKLNTGPCPCWRLHRRVFPWLSVSCSVASNLWGLLTCRSVTLASFFILMTCSAWVCLYTNCLFPVWKPAISYSATWCIWPHLNLIAPVIQIRSHSQVLRVKTWTYSFGNTIQCSQLSMLH